MKAKRGGNTVQNKEVIINYDELSFYTQKTGVRSWISVS